VNLVTLDRELRSVTIVYRLQLLQLFATDVPVARATVETHAKGAVKQSFKEGTDGRRRLRL
jgi:hypothetical protein